MVWSICLSRFGVIKSELLRLQNKHLKQQVTNHLNILKNKY